jgi:hypothetical protein
MGPRAAVVHGWTGRFRPHQSLRFRDVALLLADAERCIASAR